MLVIAQSPFQSLRKQEFLFFQLGCISPLIKNIMQLAGTLFTLEQNITGKDAIFHTLRA